MNFTNISCWKIFSCQNFLWQEIFSQSFLSTFPAGSKKTASCCELSSQQFLGFLFSIYSFVKKIQAIFSFSRKLLHNRKFPKTWVKRATKATNTFSFAHNSAAGFSQTRKHPCSEVNLHLTNYPSAGLVGPFMQPRTITFFQLYFLVTSACRVVNSAPGCPRTPPPIKTL